MKESGSNYSVTIETDPNLSRDAECKFFRDFIFTKKVEYTVNPKTEKVISSVVDSYSSNDGDCIPLHAEYDLEEE